MKYKSTDGSPERKSFIEAVVEGLPSEGELFVPEFMPKVEWSSWLETIPDLNFVSIAQKVLEPFLVEDFSSEEIKFLCKKAFHFPIPLKRIEGIDFTVLELFHGPTAAFKDVAAQFLAETLSLIKERQKKSNIAVTTQTKNPSINPKINLNTNSIINSPTKPSTNSTTNPTTNAISKPTTILVATSGDTGGAVAAAFAGRPGFRVVILFPHQGVSAFQKQQLTCWGENIISLALEGSFDDCQRIVKTLLSQNQLVSEFNLTSANSINVGRLLPQVCYYAASSLWWWKENKTPATYFIPTGNMGNAVAAFWAKSMGFPIAKIHMACNANFVLPQFYQTGKMQPQASLKTMANAMDVGNPSNWKRLHFMHPQLSQLKEISSSESISDDEIRQTIANAYHNQKEIICPHTATAWALALKRKENGIIISTAHPAKFADLVEPIIGAPIPEPASFQKIRQQPSHYQIIPSQLDAVISELKRRN